MRVNHHSDTVIDNIYSNASDIATPCRNVILRLTISDHYAVHVFCINNSVNVRQEKQIVTRRNYKQKLV